VKIIEVDADRRRLSLSLKRIEEGEQAQPLPEGAELLRPQIDLSEEVFSDEPAAEQESEATAGASTEPVDALPATTESQATDESAPDEAAEAPPATTESPATGETAPGENPAA
jgi:small subunit ribosomal protein S1